MSDTYIFSSTHLKTLLIGKGYKQLVGLNLTSTKLDNRILLRTLNELVEFGALTANDDTFFMSEDVREIVTVLGDAKSFDVVRTKKDNLPDICCYRAQKLLISRNIQANSEWYSFSFLSLDEFYDVLAQDGYLPPDGDELLSEDGLEEYEKTVEFNPLSIIGADCPILLSLDVCVNTKSHKYIRVMDYYFFKYIVVFDGETVERYPYSRNKFKEILLLMER